MNYTELQTVVFDYADCASDTSTTARFDDFLELVEARLNRTNFTKDQEGESYTELVAGTFTYPLPADYHRMRNASVAPTLTDKPEPLIYVPPTYYDIYVKDSGETGIYTLFNTNIKVWPVIDNYILSILYHKKIPPLTSLATTNWVSINHPDLYVYGLLVEICSYRKDWDTSKLWEERFMGTIAILTDQDSKTTWSGPLYTTIIA